VLSVTQKRGRRRLSDYNDGEEQSDQSLPSSSCSISSLVISFLCLVGLLLVLSAAFFPFFQDVVRRETTSTFDPRTWFNEPVFGSVD